MICTKSRQQVASLLDAGLESKLLMENVSIISRLLYDDNLEGKFAFWTQVDEQTIYSTSHAKEIFQKVWFNEELFRDIDNALIARKRKSMGSRILVSFNCSCRILKNWSAKV